ncbi:PTS transporter subunit EIIB [Mannheimia sp. E30BD]|uniref:PTS transporter subunit EIIB n=1 Tax=Mannheimia sp. E30BD TaxID=3278708 RepID=UPI00359DEDEB
MSDKDIINNIINALGNKENIKTVDACLTRLRVVLKDNSLLNKSVLKKLGAVDVVKVGDTQQIIFGTKSAQYRDEIKALIS